MNLLQEHQCCEGGVSAQSAFIRNGTIEARIESTHIQPCRISFWKVGNGSEQLLMAEKDYIVRANYAPSRRFKKIDEELYQAELHIEAINGERFYGMGENETSQVNLKGSVIDLYQRHIKAPVPFVLSSRGYGFLWNNPSLGRVEFANNLTRWVSYGCRQIDYYITTGDTYAQILEHYTAAVGRAPRLPYWASGFWQCKLRYQSQEEVLSIAKTFAERKIPLSVLVIDYLHWDVTGNWRFDPAYWPDPKGMCDELKQMGIRVMVSPWTLVAKRSIHYEEMEKSGLFTGSVDGKHDEIPFREDLCRQYDPTNPEAADYLWDKWKTSYVDKGITTFWLDPCDEFHQITEYDTATFAIGKALETHSMFVIAHQKNIYDRLRACGEKEILNIARNAWVGSWRYGVCPAPHDIECSFRHLKAYFKAGLNVMVSGIPWWNCDIGGHWTFENYCDEFYEVMIRWYQWGVFMPIFRTHGRRPNNEPWTVGGHTYPYIKNQILLRESLRDYFMEQADKACTSGLPPVRPLFFDYQNDEATYEIEDEVLFGGDILAAPVLDYRVRQRAVYLPAGVDWLDAYTAACYKGGQWISAEAPLAYIPVFIKAASPQAEMLVHRFQAFREAMLREIREEL